MFLQPRKVRSQQTALKTSERFWSGLQSPQRAGSATPAPTERRKDRAATAQRPGSDGFGEQLTKHKGWAPGEQPRPRAEASSAAVPRAPRGTAGSAWEMLRAASSPRAAVRPRVERDGEHLGGSTKQRLLPVPAVSWLPAWYVFDPQLHPSTARKDPPGLKCHKKEPGHGSQAGGRPWQCCVRGFGGRRRAPSTSFPPEAGRQAQRSEAEGMHRGFALPGSKESPEQLQVQGMKSQSRDQRAALGKEPQPQKKPAARFNNPGCV